LSQGVGRNVGLEWWVQQEGRKRRLMEIEIMSSVANSENNAGSYYYEKMMEGWVARAEMMMRT